MYARLMPIRTQTLPVCLVMRTIQILPAPRVGLDSSSLLQIVLSFGNPSYRQSYRYFYNWRSRNRTPTGVRYCQACHILYICCPRGDYNEWSTERATATAITGGVGIGHSQSEILSSMSYFIYLLSIVACPLMSPLYLMYRDSYRYCYNWRSRNSTKSTINPNTTIPQIWPPWWCRSPLIRRGIYGSARSDVRNLFWRGRAGGWLKRII